MGVGACKLGVPTLRMAHASVRMGEQTGRGPDSGTTGVWVFTCVRCYTSHGHASLHPRRKAVLLTQTLAARARLALLPGGAQRWQ